MEHFGVKLNIVNLIVISVDARTEPQQWSQVDYHDKVFALNGSQICNWRPVTPWL